MEEVALRLAGVVAEEGDLAWDAAAEIATTEG
jgi:hypothetical protein